MRNIDEKVTDKEISNILRASDLDRVCSTKRCFPENYIKKLYAGLNRTAGSTTRNSWRFS